MTTRNDHPRDDLIRMVPIPSKTLMRADGDNGDGNTLVGFPVVFNVWTEINGWEGNFLERVDPGAATKTLKERGDQVKVLFNHGFDPQIGDKPLGKPEVMEVKSQGVWTETPLAKTSYNDDIKELLSVGAIDGMSFRFSVQRDEWEEEPDASPHNPRALPERTIKEFKLYEFGPVTFPAYEATTAGVRARDAYLAYRQAKQGTTRETVEEPSVDQAKEASEDAATNPVVITITNPENGRNMPADVDPTLDIIEDSPLGDREAVAPDASPPDDPPADTPDSVHLSEDREPLMSVASYRRRADYRRSLADAAEKKEEFYDHNL